MPAKLLNFGGNDAGLFMVPRDSRGTTNRHYVDLFELMLVDTKRADL